MPDASTEAPPQVSLTLLLGKPIGRHEDAFHAALKPLGATVAGFPDGVPFITTENGCAGVISWGGHRIKFIEVIAPAPGLDGMIQSTRSNKAELAPLRTHASHVLCWYLGDAADPVDRVQACMRLALALVPSGLLGVIHTDAWQCFAPKALTQLADPAVTADLHAGLAQMILCNLIPFYGEKGTWWASKGNHVFGVPDIAVWDDGRFGLKPMQSLFASLFDYLKGGAVIQPGHTMELLGVHFTASEVTEFKDYLCGPGQTLALRPAAAAAAPAQRRAPPRPTGTAPAPARRGPVAPAQMADDDRPSGSRWINGPLIIGAVVFGLSFCVPAFHNGAGPLRLIGGIFIAIGILRALLRR